MICGLDLREKGVKTENNVKSGFSDKKVADGGWVALRTEASL